MTTVKEHYDNHLANFYAWMTGDFQTKADEFKTFLQNNNIKPASTKIAIDLGAGHGIQSIPLAQLGFQVIAIDFNQQLLHELKANAGSLDIKTVNDDIRNIEHFAHNPGLVVCGGDTLSHLAGKEEVKAFLQDIAQSLTTNGKLILSFRDYTTPLTGTARFIPVKSDDSRILTCILDYEDDSVNVTDLLHERIDNTWHQKVSTYKKVRLLATEITGYLETISMAINFNQPINRLTTIIATKL